MTTTGVSDGRGDPDSMLSSGDHIDDELAAARDDVETATASLRARTETPPSDDGRLWKAVAGLGGLSLLGAVAVVVLPGTLLQPVQFRTGTVESLRSFALLLGAFVGIFGLYVAYHREPGVDADEESIDETGDRVTARELPPLDLERARGPKNETVGAKLDEDLDRIGGMVEGDSSVQYTAHQLRRNLEGLAVRVVADAADCSTARAQHHVAQGTWTDDVRAAAFVGGPDAPERPLVMRIRDWADGEQFDRQVRATVDELAALDEGESP